MFYSILLEKLLGSKEQQQSIRSCLNAKPRILLDTTTTWDIISKLLMTRAVSFENPTKRQSLRATPHHQFTTHYCFPVEIITGKTNKNQDRQLIRNWSTEAEITLTKALTNK